MKIREARYEDIPQLVELGQLMHTESQFKQYSFNSGKVAHLIEYLITNADGIVLVAVEQDEIVGGFIGSIAEHYFGFDRYSFDFALFVKPESRNSTAGIKLLRAYVDAAKANGVNEILIGNSTGVESDRVEKLYGRMGFTRYGGNWRMRHE